MVRLDIPQEDIRPDMLRAALAGDVERVPPSMAIALVSQLDIPQPEQHALLHDVMQDDKIDEYVRAAAVRAYMRLAGDAAVAGLVKALESPGERVAAAAAGALGQVGTPEELPALARVRKRGELLGRRAAFAEVLIVHRFGVPDHEADLPTAEIQPAPIPVGALTFTTVRPGQDRRARALEGIKKEFPSLDITKQDVYEMQCGPRLMEVAFDRVFLGPNGPGPRADRPAMPAIVAFQDLEYGEFHPALLVLSRGIGRDRYKLVVTRLSGEHMYVGEGTGNKGEFEFELRSVNAPGVAPASARVRVTPKGAEITGISERRALPGQSPAPHNE